MAEVFSEVDRVCERHGPYRAKSWVLPGGLPPMESPCPSCRDEADAIAARSAQDAGSSALFRLKLSSAGIGARYHDASFENYRVTLPGQCEALAKTRAYADAFAPRGSGNLVMWGGTGTGKTHLACAIARDLMLRGFTVSYLPILTLISRYQDISSYSKNSEDSREDFFARMRAPDLLILDEIGIVSLANRDQSLLHRVIDERYNRGAPICLVGNADTLDFEKLLGERAARRLLDDATIVEFGWSKNKMNGDLFEGEYSVER